MSADLEPPRTPAWLEEIDTALARGCVGLTLTFNTADLVPDPADGRFRRLREAIAVAFDRRGYTVVGVSATTGAHQLLPSDASEASIGPIADREPRTILAELDQLLRTSERLLVIVDHADHLAPDVPDAGLADPDERYAVERLHDWGTDPSLRDRGNIVVLLSHQNALHRLLRDVPGFRNVPVPLPSCDVRLQFIERLQSLGSDDGTAYGGRGPGLSTQRLTQLTGGLRLADIEGLLRHAANTDQPLSVPAVTARKNEALRDLGQDLIEVFEPGPPLDDVVGLDHLRDFLGDMIGSGSLPQALLFAGVPGVGKSYLVRSVAAQLGYPCLALRSIRSRWVGQSERNLERVLWLIENLAPCVVMVDEIDRVMGRRSEHGSADGGTSERLLARIWEFLGETSADRGVLWIATTNRPDLLDVASLDRFEATVPFLHPGPQQVAALLPDLARQQGRHFSADVDASRISDHPSLHQPTVRALHQVVRVAGWWSDLAAGQSGEAVSATHLERAVADYRPTHDPLEHEHIALHTLKMTEFQFLLPWRTRHGRRPDVEIPDYVEPLLDERGDIDLDLLDARLAELRHLRAGHPLPRPTPR